MTEPDRGRRRGPARGRYPARWRRSPELPPFSGWRIVILGIVLQMMTGPGQTIGVSVFIDPMIDGLGATRSEISTAYMVGTLIGALGLPAIGRFFDARGARRATAIIGVAFGTVLVLMAGVQGLVSLTIGFIGIRMLGQGGLTLVASTAPAPWFDRRRGLAIGITSGVGASATALVPVLATTLILTVGWRAAWLTLGLIVWTVLLPIARWGLINRPSDVGQHPDGITPAPTSPDGETSPDGDVNSGREATMGARSLTSKEAVRTPIFWAVTGAIFVASMITTGLNFHQISILGEQGLNPIEAATNFLPQTLAGLVVALSVGGLVDRFRQRFVIATTMALLATAMTFVSSVQPGLLAIIYGLILGSTQGAMRSLESASYPKLFGVRHVGEIRGIARAINVAGSAFGPLALSIGFQVTGSYRQVLLGLLVLPAIAAIFGLVASEPSGPQGGRTAANA